MQNPDCMTAGSALAGPVAHTRNTREEQIMWGVDGD